MSAFGEDIVAAWAGSVSVVFFWESSLQKSQTFEHCQSGDASTG